MSGTMDVMNSNLSGAQFRTVTKDVCAECVPAGATATKALDDNSGRCAVCGTHNGNRVRATYQVEAPKPVVHEPYEDDEPDEVGPHAFVESRFSALRKEGLCRTCGKPHS